MYATKCTVVLPDANVCVLCLPVNNKAFKLELRVDIKGVTQKTGDLHIELNGMDVDMQQFPARVSNGLPKRTYLHIHVLYFTKHQGCLVCAAI